MTDTTENTEVTESNQIDDPAAVLAALDRAKKEAKRFREERDRLKEQADGSEWRNRAVKAEVRSQLVELGIKDTARLMKYVDVSGVDVDDEGNFVGLEESIDTLRSDFPELFDPKRRAGGNADIFADNPANPSKSSSQKQAELLLGR